MEELGQKKQVLEITNKELLNENETLLKKEQWKSLLTRMEEFMYGVEGIVTTAYTDENLDTYNWNMDKIIEIIKDLKELQIEQNGLLEEQKEILLRFQKSFLEIENGKNNIQGIYQEMKKIYENSEEY